MIQCVTEMPTPVHLGRYHHMLLSSLEPMFQLIKLIHLQNF